MEATTTTVMRSLSLSPHHRRSHLPAVRSPAPRVLPIRRARSEADLVRSMAASVSAVLRPRILEEEEEEDDDAPIENCFGGFGAGDKGNNSGVSGRGRGKDGSGRGGGHSAGMGEHYRRMLKLDPNNPLLLRNYGKHLHEVDGDLAGAEEYYGRALLACPGDADVLSLYGRVLWEARLDKDRATGYFERAVQAAPDDCYVLGSYASFLWDAEVGEDEDGTAEKATTAAASGSPTLVPAC